MLPADELKVAGLSLAPAGKRRDVVDLKLVGGVAAPQSLGVAVLAAVLGSLEDRSFQGHWDVSRSRLRRRSGVRMRTRSFTLGLSFKTVFLKKLVTHDVEQLGVSSGWSG